MIKILDAGFLKTSVATIMRQWALGGTYNGWLKDTGGYAGACTALHLPTGTTLMFTRDEGMHSSGWWKNPDYERCWHLSLSFFDPTTILLRDVYPRGAAPGSLLLGRLANATRVGRDKRFTKEWLDAFYGSDQKLLWCEPPYSPEGKAADVWHYRLFCAPNWTPILPRGEVYHKEFTEKGWKSFSDVMADLQMDRKEVEERLQDASFHQAGDGT